MHSLRNVRVQHKASKYAEHTWPSSLTNPNWIASSREGMIEQELSFWDPKNMLVGACNMLKPMKWSKAKDCK
jgi:hypothetical protein